MMRQEEHPPIQRVIGIDPGPTPGVVVLDCSGDALVRVEALQCTPGALPGVLAAFCTPGTTSLAVERFVSRGRASHDQRLTADQVVLLQDLWPDVVLRPAAEVKPWATEMRLARAGLLEPTKGMRHARDAGKQALFAAAHAGLIPDPLSKHFTTDSNRTYRKA